ncbi:MAG: alpha/beta hydrolase family protein [Fidelibacterota bacterium]
MRFGEVTIIALSFLALVLTILPKRNRKYPRYLIAVIAGVTLWHLAVEGYRWQMVPAYLFLGLLWLAYQRGRPAGVLRGVGLFLGLIVSIIPPLAMPIFDFPPPTGHHAIGTVTYHWRDTTRPEWFTENPEDARELMVQFWYPGIPVDGMEPLPYMDHMNIRGPAIARQGDLPSFMPGYLDLIKTHAFSQIPISRDRQAYPLLVVSHGLGSVRFLHTALIEELVSHGYVVAAPDHTYDCSLTVFPDERVAPYASGIPPNVAPEDSARIRARQLATRVTDVRFVLDQAERLNAGIIEGPLTGKLDLDRIGILGHSFGGTTAIQACQEDPRFKACLALDSWMLVVPETTVRAGLDQPFLYMGRSTWPDSRNDERLKSLMSRNRNDQVRITIRGSHHFDYTDTPLFSPFMSLLGKSGTIPGSRVVEIVNGYTLAFFNRHLKGEPGLLLTGESPYPEVKSE